MKIGHRLLIVTLTTAALIWVVGLYATATAQKSLQLAIEEECSVHAAAVMHEIDRAIQYHITGWLAYSRSPLVQRTLAESNYAFDALADARAHIDGIDEAWKAQAPRVLPLVEELAANDLAQDMRVRLDVLEKSYGYRVFGEAFITNRHGANVAQTNETSDYRQDDEEWWREAQATGCYVKDVGFDDSAAVYSTDLCLRIVDDRENFIGVIKAVLNIQEIIAIVERRTLDSQHSQGCFTLLTSKGRVIHEGTKSSEPLGDGSRFLDGISVSQANPLSTRVRVDPDSKARLLSAVALSQGHEDYKGLGWRLAREVPEAAVFAPVQAMRGQINIIAATATIAALVIGGAIALSLGRRIRLLHAATKQVGSGVQNLKLDVKGSDELGSLARAFQDMASRLDHATDELRRQAEVLHDRNGRLEQEIVERKRAESERERLHSELLEVSRRAGMAEVATGVLHNVGNVLNSVNVSASLLTNKIQQTPAVDLRPICAMLKGATDVGSFLKSDPKGKVILPFLEELSSVMARDRATFVEELQCLHKNIDHIRDIVSMQQSYARVVGTAEFVTAAELVEDALRINSMALARHRTTIVREFEEIPQILVDKHKVVQILVNLISNAKYALDEVQHDDRRVTVRIEKTGEEADRIRIVVRDNGVGIAPENLTRVFQHGYTTRKEGHGFGLHSSAIAAQQIGGKLHAASEGVGHGATFTLEIPVLSVEVPA